MDGMKKTILLLVLILAINPITFISAQEPQANPKNVEIATRFTYILDNGFEKIDLMKVGSIDKSFFNLGNAQLIICDKNDKNKKNILNLILYQP